MRRIGFLVILLLVIVQIVLAQSPIGCRNGSYWCGRSYNNYRPYPPVTSWAAYNGYGYGGGVWQGVAATAAGAGISIAAGEATRRLDEAAQGRAEQRSQKQLIPRSQYKDCKAFISEDGKSRMISCIGDDDKWVQILEKPVPVRP